jgi:hypothetical protein
MKKKSKITEFSDYFFFGSLFYFTTDLDDFLLKKGLDTYFFHGIIEAIRREIFFSEIRRELGTGCVAGYALIICSKICYALMPLLSISVVNSRGC